MDVSLPRIHNAETIPWDKIFRRLNSPRCSLSTFAVGVAVLVLSVLHTHNQKATSSQDNAGFMTRGAVGRNEAPLIPLPKACRGPCCSSTAPNSSPGSPKMVSVWWSNALYNGSKIQISSGHGTWWGPGHGDTGFLNWSSISCHHREPLGARQALTVLRAGPTSVRLVTPSGTYLVARETDMLGADETSPTPATVFTAIPVEGSSELLELRAANGKYVTCTQEGELRLYAERVPEWERFKVMAVASLPVWRGVNLGSWLVVEDWMVPALMAVAQGQVGPGGAPIPDSLHGEWKLAQALGKHRARWRLERHYRSFVQRRHFRFLQQQGVNAVRVPVGWWAARGGKALGDWDFLQGHVKYLDRAFDLAGRHGMGVLLALHASPGTERSRALDGQLDWGVFPELVALMLEAVEWLAQRYSVRANYLGITLLSENLVNGMPRDVLKKFYIDGYAAVRRHSPCAFVGIAPRHKGDLNELKLAMVGETFSNVLLELHLYNAFNSALANKPIYHTLRYVEEDTAREIQELEASGHMVVVGEWSLGLAEGVEATDEQVREYAEVQLATLGKARAGWFFWSLRMGRSGWPHWSFEESVAKGWLRRAPDNSWV